MFHYECNNTSALGVNLFMMQVYSMDQRAGTITPSRQKFEPTEEEKSRGRRFGAWVRQAAALKDWKKSDLATATGLNPGGLGILWDNCVDKQTGRIRRPEEETITLIAQATGANENAGRLAADYNALPGSVPSEIGLPSGGSMLLVGVTGVEDLTGSQRQLIGATMETMLKNIRKEPN